LAVADELEERTANDDSEQVVCGSGGSSWGRRRYCIFDGDGSAAEITKLADGNSARDFVEYRFGEEQSALYGGQHTAYGTRDFAWYLEPSYDYKFGPGHEHSLGVSGGLLISIP
jgi:hypothetical protein